MDNRNAVALTRTNDDEMTTKPNATSAPAPNKPRWKWSGEDEPQPYYCHEDNDTMTLTADETRYIKWYNANAHKEWHNADDDDDVEHEEHEEFTHVPFMNLKKDEREKKSTQFKFGLCSDCDAGLDDKSEFVCTNSGFMCNACHEYYQRLIYMIPVGCGGCN